MTPENLIALQTAIDTIHNITNENDGVVLLLSSIPQSDNTRFCNAKLLLNGTSESIAKSLRNGAAQNNRFKDILLDAVNDLGNSIDFPIDFDFSPDQKQQTAAHLDQIKDMQDKYPEIKDQLQVFVNYFNGVIRGLTLKETA